MFFFFFFFFFFQAEDGIRDLTVTGVQTCALPIYEGAERVIAYITHPVLSGKAVERISASALDELVVTDTIPLGDEARKCRRIRVLSVAELLAETMRRIRDEESVSSLYMD